MKSNHNIEDRVNVTSGVLYIVVHSGKYFPKKDLFQGPDPYVNVTFGKLFSQTKIINNTIEPIWDELITYHVEFQPHLDNDVVKLKECRPGNFLNFRILNKNLIKDSEIGKVDLDLDTCCFVHDKLLKHALEFGGKNSMLLIFSYFKPLNLYIPKELTEIKKKGKESIFCTTNLLPKEVQFMKKRNSKIKTSLLKLLNLEKEPEKLKKIPNISIVTSGGGTRAQIASLGSFVGLDKNGILDVTSYVSTCSGSIWSFLPYLENDEKSFSKFKDELINLMTHSFLKVDKKTIKEIFGNLYDRYVNGMDLGIIDIYGELLSHHFFKEAKSKELSFSYLRKKNLMLNHEIPFPILSSVVVKKNVDEYTFSKWFEHTPYYSGIIDYGNYIKSSNFGCRFEKGQKISSSNKDNMGYIMAACSSAFNVSLDKIFKDFSTFDPVLNKIFSPLIDKTVLTDKRLDPAEINNPWYCCDNKDIGELSKILLIDAGIRLNLPIHPVLRAERLADIILIFDNSFDVNKKKKWLAIEQAVKYSKSNNLPFPEIDFKILEKPEPYYIFKGNQEKSIPTVIYYLLQTTSQSKLLDDPVDLPKGFPMVSTSKLSYDKKTSENLTCLTESHVDSSIPDLLKIIKEYAL